MRSATALSRILLLLLLLLPPPPAAAYFGLTGKEALTQFPAPGAGAAPGRAHVKQCELLQLSRRQKRLCRREPGLAETLRDAIRLGILECQLQFRSERWNCSLEGRTSLLKRAQKGKFLELKKLFMIILSVFLTSAPSSTSENLKMTIE
ncbi:hypothetical protein WISP_98967 [Willisornis vidua]|uniref:Protein Wnt n=1 Tax=Willisornis vidua TaxID=1566151 RepID=A0ABQ9CZ52_9PASS|nr:hypothetical protein WISP_98967 [Willisornis vidua]